MKLVVASHNPHKAAEIRAILGNIPDLEIVSLGSGLPEIVEDKDTFLGNAAKKAIETARAISGKVLPGDSAGGDFRPRRGGVRSEGKSFPGVAGIAVLADDSGLSVDALNGAPGVYSARYAGENATSVQLCEKLLRELKDVPPARRTAHFITVLVVADSEKILYTAEGKVEGLITEEMRGAQGFGYDPVFYYPPLQKTFAELMPEEKNKHSHRYRALQNLLTQLKTG